jgi:alkylation response protein AidB-like acyl-CoA dehydrogenase
LEGNATDHEPAQPSMTPELQPLAPHLTGGHFLLSETDPSVVFTPEDLSAEQRMMAETARQFMEKAVLPNLDALEHQEPGLAVRVFKEAGALGLHAIELAEEFGGLGLGKIEGLGVAEQLTRLGGFGVTCGAHTGIGIQPLAYFGTEAQRKKYLPRLASGEWMAAYCLSETGSGSDALGMKTKAVLSPDGQHYVLNGTKMWISNAAWADLFTIFAKVDGQQVTAFLVERTTPGLSFGKEEHKLGIKSSSTRRVILEDVAVPVENVLGEVGKGAYIAFNILNFGRFGLGAGAVGAAKDALAIAARYATERHQFGRPIASFGLIQHKLGEMASRCFAAESAVYRTAGMIDAVMAGGEKMDSVRPGFPRALDEFAIECSILKVACSEILDEVTDETLQIHGGYGFSEEFVPARLCRDSRINRIFEGTNEINRLFIPGTLMRRSQRGRFPLIPAVGKVAQEVLELGAIEETSDPLANARAFLGNARKLILFVCGVAYQKFGEKLADQQEVLAVLSDLMIDLFLAESAVLRALKARGRSGAAATMTDLAVIFVNEAVNRMEHRTRAGLAAISTGDELKAQLGIVRRLLRWTPVNAVEMRRRLAQRLCETGSYAALVG